MLDLLPIVHPAPGDDRVIGAAIPHEAPGGGQPHDLEIYWDDPPCGAFLVEPSTVDPLTVVEPIRCPCGFTATVTGGTVTETPTVEATVPNPETGPVPADAALGQTVLTGEADVIPGEPTNDGAADNTDEEETDR